MTVRAHGSLSHRTTRRSVLVATLAIAAIAACHEVNTDPTVLASLSFDTLPAPSVVVGDSMRDTFGIAQPLHGTAFNIEGDTLADFPLRYRALDSGVTVDSVTGYVIAGDSTRPIPIRVLADARGLQSPSMQLYVIQPPDTLVGIDTLDSLTYSFRDSATNVTTALSVSVAHRETAETLRALPAYLVSFVIQHAPPAETTVPGADTLVAQLVDADGSKPARAFASDPSTGLARARLRIRPGYLASLEDDSVVVIASAKYRGVPITGSGVRLVLRLKQPTP